MGTNMKMRKLSRNMSYLISLSPNKSYQETIFWRAYVTICPFNFVYFVNLAPQLIILSNPPSYLQKIVKLAFLIKLAHAAVQSFKLKKPHENKKIHVI